MVGTFEAVPYPGSASPFAGDFTLIDSVDAPTTSTRPPASPTSRTGSTHVPGDSDPGRLTGRRPYDSAGGQRAATLSAAPHGAAIWRDADQREDPL